MRPVLTAILLLVFALAVGAEFNLSAHLYENETANSVVATPLYSPPGVNYTLYTIGGIPSILTAGDTPMADSVTIASVLRAHYEHALLPSEQELAALQDHLSAFNASRNLKTAGGKPYPDGLEWTCLRNAGIGDAAHHTFLLCSDSASCAKSATQFCMLYGFDICDPSSISPLILDYSASISTYNTELPAILSLSSDLSLDNAAESIARMKIKLASLKSAAQANMQTKLRFTVASQCRDCLGICPAPNLDLASLDAASDLVTNLSSRVQSAPNLEIAAQQIMLSSADREAYARSAALAAVWGPKWNQFKSKYQSLRDESSAVSSFNKDSNFTASFSTFQAAWNAMDAHISTRTFAAVDSDFSRINALIPSIQSAVNSGRKPYDGVKLAQNHAGDALIAASWRIRSGDNAAIGAYQKLVSRRLALDAALTPPLTTAQYANMTAAYNALIGDISKLRSNGVGSGDAVSNFGRAFSQTAVDGVFSLSAALVPLSSVTRNQVAPLIPPAILLLSNLALASVILVVFIGLLLYFKPLFRSRAMLGLWTAVLFMLLFGLGLGSVGLYVVMTQNAQSATLADFTDLIPAANMTYVAIDTAGAPQDALNAMSACAANITSQVKSHWNKTASTFLFAGKTCTWGGASNLSAASCFDKVVDSPVFVLHYNKTASAPHFDTVFQKQANTWGDAAYYARCEIGDVLN